MLTHVVLFKLKDPGKAQETANVLMNMKGKIPQLLEIEVGLDVLHSERSYDVALITKFHSLADMEQYQVHPVHQEVIQYMTQVREASVSVDFES